MGYSSKICPLRLGSAPIHCQKNKCAWWVNSECAIVKIAMNS